jgi:Cu(I)/Ag(I) efflux system membrane protein CusA/SilA
LSLPRDGDVSATTIDETVAQARQPPSGGPHFLADRLVSQEPISSGLWRLAYYAWGVWAVRHTPVDAIPDLSENQVIVFAEWSGRSPQEVEDQVTYPLSTNLQGLAGVKEVRASSMFGFALLTVVFDDKIDNYFARTRVLERLSFLQTLLPEGVTPQLGPDATGLGWVFQYYLKVDPAESSSSGAPSGFDLGNLTFASGFLCSLPVGRSRGSC